MNNDNMSSVWQFSWSKKGEWWEINFKKNKVIMKGYS